MKRAHRAQVPPEGIYKTHEFFFQEQYRRLGIIQNVSKLRRCQPMIERKQHAARFQNSVVGFQQPMAIQAEERHAISRLHSGAAQCSRQTPDTNRRTRRR